jgi:putative copper export protein
MLDKSIRFVHVLSSMVWSAGAIVFYVLAALVLRGPRDRTAEFVARLSTTGPALFAPSLVLLLATGLWLVAEDDQIAFR